MKQLLKILILLIVITSPALSQKEKPLNNPIYDNQPYHFGFKIGITSNKFHIDYGNLFASQTNFDQILTEYEPGFNVGIIMDVLIANNINLRITPSFNFTDQKIYFIKNNTENIEPKNNTGISNFEIPIYLKYRSERINNGRAYILLGGNLIMNMSGNEKLTQSQNIEFKNTNYSIDIGFGVDIYFAYFKFSPEIKYAYGLRNILVNQNNEYNELINGLTTRSILISFTFE